MLLIYKNVYDFDLTRWVNRIFHIMEDRTKSLNYYNFPYILVITFISLDEQLAL